MIVFHQCLFFYSAEDTNRELHMIIIDKAQIDSITTLYFIEYTMGKLLIFGFATRFFSHLSVQFV